MGEKIDMRGKWSATPRTITITTTWEDGVPVKSSESQKGRIVNGRLHFTFDEEVTFEIVLARS